METATGISADSANGAGISTSILRSENTAVDAPVSSCDTTIPAVMRTAPMSLIAMAIRSPVGFCRKTTRAYAAFCGTVVPG